MTTPHPDRSPDHHSGPGADDVADRLARRAGGIDLGPPMVDVVMARGHQRRQRRRAAVGLTAAVSIVGGSVVAIAALSRPSSEGSVVAAPTGTDEVPAITMISETTSPEASASTVPAPVDTLPAAPVATVESSFVWNRVDPDSSEAVIVFWGGQEPMLAGSGPFVAWSTSPGVTDSYGQVMWRSDDGISWEQVTESPPIGSRSVAEHDGRFFVYGTAPAATSGRRSDLALGTSDDGGRTWDTKVLPIDTSALAAEPGVESVGVNATSIAASSAGVLVSAQVTASVDLVSALPAEYREGGYEYDDTGITAQTSACAGVTSTTVVSPGDGATVSASTVPAGDTVPGTSTPIDGSGCPTERFTWAELGVSETAARAALFPETRVFLSTDGETFEEVAPPTTTADGWSGLRVTPYLDGFAAVTAINHVDGSTTSTLWFSDDGRSWTDAGELPVGYPESLAAMGDRIVVTGWNWAANRSYVAVRDASGSWAATDLSGFVLPSDGKLVTISPTHVSVTDAGVSMIGWMFVDPVAEAGGVSFSKDGITVFIDDMNQNQRVVDAATGEQLGVVGPMGGSDTGLVTQRPEDGVYEVRREPGGDVVATYSYTDIENAIAEVGPYDSSNSELLFLHSSDGISWSRESLDELAGAPVSSSGGIRVSGDQVLVAVNLDERNPNGTAKQVVLVATPKT